MTVKRVLETKGGFVQVVRSDSPVAEAIDRMEEEGASALIVSDDNRDISGILTERDVVRGLNAHKAGVVDKRVGDLMTRKVGACDYAERMERVYELMSRHKIRHMPIVKSGLLAGIISILDVVRYRLGEVAAEREALKDYVGGRN